MKVVRFTAQHSIYNGGEVAGFPDEKAQELVERKVAEYLPADKVRKPATLEELLAEVVQRGYPRKSAKKIAADRFAGKYGEEARYLGAVSQEDVQSGSSTNTDAEDEEAEGDNEPSGTELGEQQQSSQDGTEDEQQGSNQ